MPLKQGTEALPKELLPAEKQQIPPSLTPLKDSASPQTSFYPTALGGFVLLPADTNLPPDTHQV